MPRVASAALALLLAFAASPLAAPQPASAAVAPPLPESAGRDEPSARANPTDRWIVVYRDGADLKTANGRARGRGIDRSSAVNKAGERVHAAVRRGVSAGLTFAGRRCGVVKLSRRPGDLTEWDKTNFYSC